MKKTMMTLAIVTLVLGVAIFGTVSAVSAQKAETVVLAETLADPMVYLAGWDGTNGTCDGTCDGSQDHFGWGEDGAGRQFQLGNQGAESCPNDGTCTMDQTQIRQQLRDGSCGAEPGTGAGTRTRTGKGN
jgi:hypothetical protein